MDALREGAMTLGLNTPSQRFMFSSALGIIIIYTLRPSTHFTPEGAPKPMAALSSEEDKIRFGSLPILPWWSPALAAGLISASLM
jgi:hypothetical protein